MAEPKVGPPRNQLDRLPREMQPEDERKPNEIDPLALLLTAAQGADMFQTDRGIDLTRGKTIILTPEEVSQHGLDPSITWQHSLQEANPLPGMQSPIGRMAWGAAENAGLRKLKEKAPKLGVPATLAAILAHAFLAGRWQNQMNGVGKSR